MKLTAAFSGVLTLTLVASSAWANITSYKLGITRDGVKDTQLVYQLWSGEYPEPVIDIKNKSKGMTTVQGFTSLRTPTDKISCTVKNGLYHPWSRTGNSVVSFMTIIGADEFQALQDVEAEDKILIPTGSTLTNVIATSEGFCTAQFEAAGKMQSADFFCDELSNKELFKQTSTTRPLFEQWLQLQCAEGYKVYTEAYDLLKQKGVTSGTITDWGSVGSIPIKKQKIKNKK